MQLNKVLTYCSYRVYNNSICFLLKNINFEEFFVAFSRDVTIEKYNREIFRKVEAEISISQWGERMKSRLMKLLVLSLVLLLLLSISLACDSKDKEKSPQKKVALIMEGAISDMGWNATSYEGLKKIEALGAQIGHTENTPVSDAADAIRTFADDGYDVIFMSSSSYQDLAMELAEEYPDVQFFLINSRVTADNVRSFAIQDAEQGFLMGALSALLTKTGTVGFIGGLEIAPILNGQKGYDQGVRYVNPDIRILSQNTGSMDDVSAAKELAKAFINEGVDVLSPMATQATLGVMEAAEEMGVYALCYGLNQETVAPNAAVVAVVKDTSIVYEVAYKSYLEGNMPREILPMGVAQGVVRVGDFYLDVDQAIIDQIKEIENKLAKGEITISLD